MDTKKLNNTQFIFQINKTDIQYSKILDQISSINPSLLQYHIYLQNYGMVPFKTEGNLRNATQKLKKQILAQYDQEIQEYDFQQAVIDEKDLYYETQNLKQTLETIQAMIGKDEDHTPRIIQKKDIQNIIQQQTTLDLLISLLQLTNIFMNRPPFKQNKSEVEEGPPRERKLWVKVQGKLAPLNDKNEAFDKIIKKYQNKTPFKIAEKQLITIYQKLMQLLKKLLDQNKNSSQHFLQVCDEFLYQKCNDNCSLARELITIAFTSAYYLRENKDLNGDTLQKWTDKLKNIRGDNIQQQNQLINMLQYSFQYKQKSNHIYQNRFLKEVLVQDLNSERKDEFKPEKGFGKFSLFNQNPAIEYNADPNFLKDNPIIQQALKQKRLRNYSNQDKFLFFLKDLNVLSESNDNDYAININNILYLIGALCCNKNGKAQKLINKMGINSQFLITMLEDQSLSFKQQIITQIPILEIYQNLILDLADQTYIKQFQSKTVIWESQTQSSSSNLLAPISSILQNFDSNISEGLTQGFIIESMHNFWIKDFSKNFVPAVFFNFRSLISMTQAIFIVFMTIFYI